MDGRTTIYSWMQNVKCWFFSFYFIIFILFLFFFSFCFWTKTVFHWVGIENWMHIKWILINNINKEEKERSKTDNLIHAFNEMHQEALKGEWENLARVHAIGKYPGKINWTYETVCKRIGTRRKLNLWEKEKLWFIVYAFSQSIYQNSIFNPEFLILFNDLCETVHDERYKSAMNGPNTIRSFLQIF